MVESSYTIGVIEGKLQGKEEQGIEQGEKQKVLEIAKKLIDVLDVQIIADKTGLSCAEITALK